MSTRATILALWRRLTNCRPGPMRLADQKRRLEAVCRAAGCSKSQATAIAGEFFRKG